MPVWSGVPRAKLSSDVVLLSCTATMFIFGLRELLLLMHVHASSGYRGTRAEVSYTRRDSCLLILPRTSDLGRASGRWCRGSLSRT
jgi:hypothetical protein